MLLPKAFEEGISICRVREVVNAMATAFQFKKQSRRKLSCTVCQT